MDALFAPAPEPATPLGRLRILAPTAGVKVSPFFLGGGNIGTAWGKGIGMDKETSFAYLDNFVAAGGNAIDLASGYQEEQSETWVGEWMAARGNRDRLVVATKFTFAYKAHVYGKTESATYAGNSRKAIHLSVRDSLLKLRTDYLDVLYLHWWDFTTSIEEVMDSLHVLVQQGKILYLGVSDTPAWIVAAANTYAKAHGKTPFSVYQGRYNLMRRDLEREVLPVVRHFGMALALWDVLGGGRFQSAKQIEAKKAGGETIRAVMGNSPEQTEDEKAYSAALEHVAAEHGTESLTAVAIAYAQSKAPYVFPIVGGRKPEHLAGNIEALTLKLTEAQIGYLEAVRPFDVGFPANFVGENPSVTGKPTPLLAASAAVDVVRGPVAIGLQQ